MLTSTAPGPYRAHRSRLALALLLPLACRPAAPEPAEPEPPPVVLPELGAEIDTTPLDLGPDPLPEGVVAAVDGAPIHQEELQRLIQAAPPSEDPAAVRAAALVQLVERRLLQARADQLDVRATEDEVLAWLEEHSLDRLGTEPGTPGLEQIAWRMRDPGFYARCLALLARRHVYHPVLWSYAVLHRDAANIAEFLLHQEAFLDACGGGLEGSLVRIDPVERRRYEHLEYAPLVNARAHRLGARLEILNDRFAAQYRRLLECLCYQRALDDDDRLAVAGYLLLQDRQAEALAMFDRVDRAQVHTGLQYDYVHVHVHLLRQDPQAAREIAERYRDYPVDRWRHLFEAALAQLDELQGSEARVVDPEARDEQQAVLAQTEPALELRVEDGRVTVTYQNLSEVRVAYYRMDIELLFSRQPFVQQQADRFSLIKPGRVDRVALPAGQDAVAFELPADVHGSNVVVEASAQGLRRQQAYFAHALVVQVIEGYGQLRVTQRGSGQPLPCTYV
ncbi:MAG: hypothetical protein KDK70_00005, partial [Myxococcales bacterium]|nr:hypothetical protein [Myxococcales bacterium]